MEPMKPMAPMAPMTPLEPMAQGPAWWPAALGEPSSSGGQDGRDYAFFAGKRRLAVRVGDTVTIYDSGDHAITGASQRHGDGDRLALESQHGTVDLDDLRRVP